MPDYMEYVDDHNHGYALALTLRSCDAFPPISLADWFLLTRVRSFYRIDTSLTTLHAQFVALDADLKETILDEFWIEKVPPPAL